MIGEILEEKFHLVGVEMEHTDLVGQVKLKSPK